MFRLLDIGYKSLWSLQLVLPISHFLEFESGHISIMMEEEMKKTHSTNHESSVKNWLKGSSSTQTTHLSTTTSKHNNPNPNNPDFISDLPDSLLLHILSLLNMNQVMKMSILSRRWRYLWKSIPCLCFEWLPDLLNYTNFIDKCLFHHEGSKVHKLHINLSYDEYTHAPLVDSWFHFAIKCKVEDFALECYLRNYYEYVELYKLPRSFYSCTPLTSLYLYGCNLNLPDSFQLCSLKKLSLELLELYSDSIERLSSSCPLLEEIYLIDCNRGRYLINIGITNENIKRLEISCYGQSGFGTVMINAPTLPSLRIYRCDPRVRFYVEELESLVNVDLIGGSVLNCYVDDDLKQIRNCVENFLYDFRHVKHLKLCGMRLQVLSLTKLQSSSDILPICVTSLELYASLEKWELPGISYMLESCSNLQKLKIVNQICSVEIQLSNEFIDEHDFEEEEYWESFETDGPSIMQNVNTIEINLEDESHHEEFVRFLLKNAKVLERMVINTPKKYANNFELQFSFSQRMNAFPRSSPNAKLFIT